MITMHILDNKVASWYLCQLTEATKPTLDAIKDVNWLLFSKTPSEWFFTIYRFFMIFIGSLAFLIVWICSLFLWSIPIILLEYAVGRFTRSGVLMGFRKFVGPKMVFIGGWVCMVTFLIRFESQFIVYTFQRAYFNEFVFAKTLYLSLIPV